MIVTNVLYNVKGVIDQEEGLHGWLLAKLLFVVPFLDVLWYLKNTHKNPKFGRVRQVPIRELGWEFPGWDLSHVAKFGIFVCIL